MYEYESYEYPAYAEVVARVGEHTHIYIFPRDEADFAVETVKRHVCDGRLHPYAGLIVCNMVRELQDES